MSRQNYFATNQALWDLKTEWHLKSEFYDMPGFLAKRNSLMPTELEEIGHLVAGKRLLHLQCHFGQDTLSWVQLGAEAVGVDFSSKAIEAARSLSEQLRLPARFVLSNVFDLPQNLPPAADFDIVFCSYGSIVWLDDLYAWARIVIQYLRPGGFFYIVDFHPTYMLFNFDTMRVEYGYFNAQAPFHEMHTGTYAQADAPIEAEEYFWNHSLSEIIGALQAAGLRLEFLHEFPYSHFDCFPNLVPCGEKRYQVRGYEGMLPLMFSLKACKPEA